MWSMVWGLIDTKPSLLYMYISAMVSEAANFMLLRLIINDNKQSMQKHKYHLTALSNKMAMTSLTI